MLFLSIVKCDLKAQLIEQLRDPVLLNSIADLLLAKLENKSIRSEISLVRHENMSFRGKTWKALKSDSLVGCENTCKLYSKCNAYTFNRGELDCYLKTRQSKMRKQNQMVSGELRRSYIRNYYKFSFTV